jgi:hypothetical protein
VRALLSFVVLLVVATGATGCHRPDRCLSTCEERQKQLGCHPAVDCKTSCGKLHAAPSCQAELKNFEECFLAKPLDKWMCDTTGLPVVKEEECATERHIVMGCLEMGGNPPPGPPAKKP